jgi:hypothetical protein
VVWSISRAFLKRKRAAGRVVNFKESFERQLRKQNGIRQKVSVLVGVRLFIFLI